MSSVSSSSSSVSDLLGPVLVDNRASKLTRYMCTSFDISKEPAFVDEEMYFLAYQREVCPRTKNMHWQIYVELKRRLRYSQVSGLLGVAVDCRMCNGTPDQCLAYVKKDASFDTANPIRKEFGVLSKGKGVKRNLEAVIEDVKEHGVKKALSMHPEDVLRHMNALLKVEAMYYDRPVYCKKMEHLRGFQKQVLDLVATEADDRHVYWFCDKVGNCGKSKLRIELLAFHGAFASNGGKATDIIHNASEFVRRKEDCKVFVFDFARCSADFVSYGAIEQIKDGQWSSTKYHGGQVSIKPPHVICFSNDWPDLNKMSIDRWKLFEIIQQDDDFITKECKPFLVGNNTYVVTDM